MHRDEARRLLDRIRVLKHACDLDLLVFFARHPRSLLASESLASFLGYDLKDIAASLDVLLGAGLLKRAQTPAHAARLYVFALNGAHVGPDGGWLPALLEMASTRQGRLALRETLRRRSSEGPGGVLAQAGDGAITRPGPQAFVVRPKPHAVPRQAQHGTHELRPSGRQKRRA
jgi:hypothetical protein